jgi:ATP-dependent Clp protease ATP-binding subunit ClpA
MDDNVKLSSMGVLNLPSLVQEVGRRGGDSPLDRVEAALAVGEELADGADELIGHFVAETRQAGCSWTQIGERMGVSKQAARQRFTVLPGPARLGSLAQQPRLVACLAAAAREAAADGAAEIGTHHQLLGLYEEGVAAAILEKLGIRAEEVRRTAREMFPGGAEPAERPPPESAEARHAVEGAAALARRAGLDYVGPAHLLGALTLDQGSRARRVLGRLGADIHAIKKELECYLNPGKQRRRRHGGRADGQQCSFCGWAAPGGAQMVAGPGVRICADCVRLADEVLAGRAGA